MYKKDMKSLVNYAMELDLVGLEIKEGYNGIPLLTVTTYNSSHADLIQEFAKNISWETNRYVEYVIGLIKVSVVFGEDAVDNSIHHIKED